MGDGLERKKWENAMNHKSLNPLMYSNQIEKYSLL